MVEAESVISVQNSWETATVSPGDCRFSYLHAELMSNSHTVSSVDCRFSYIHAELVRDSHRIIR